jgi:MFS family permease
VFSVKKLYIISLIIFEAGSLLCTVAPNSPAFICGRTIAGIGNSGIYAGLNTIITHSFPNHKRPVMTGLAIGVFTLAMASAPLVGGALIDAWSWRLCFGINLPLGVIAVALTAYGFQSPIENPDTKLPLKEKIKRIDAWSTLILIPGITCLLLALQWGGTRYGWNNAIIIALLVASVVLIAVFSYLQYRLQDKAALPPRILKKRSILAGAWFNLCINGALAITEQYLSIYFQGVKGYTAAKAGILGVPLIVGLAVGVPLSGAAISLVGYYSREYNHSILFTNRD